MRSGSARAALPSFASLDAWLTMDAKKASSSRFSPKMLRSAALSSSSFASRKKMEAVGRLAGGIAHDFNNLLMVISGYSEFLLERLGAEPHLRGPAQEIAGAADRASSLTRQLLAFSRKQMLAPRIVSLNDVVTENIKMLTRM